MSNAKYKGRTAKVRKPKTAADGKYDPTNAVTALKDIILMVGEANTETEHRIKLIAERAIAKAQGH